MAVISTPLRCGVGEKNDATSMPLICEATRVEMSEEASKA